MTRQAQQQEGRFSKAGSRPFPLAEEFGAVRPPTISGAPVSCHVLPKGDVQAETMMPQEKPEGLLVS